MRDAERPRASVLRYLGENEEERVKENDEVVRVNEKKEEEYRKDLQFLVEKEAEDEESDEEEEDTSQCSEQEEQVKEAKLAGGGRDGKIVCEVTFVLKDWFR